MSKKPAKIQKLFYIRKCARNFIKKKRVYVQKTKIFCFSFSTFKIL